MPATQWPIPFPYHHAVRRPVDHGETCVVDFMDGRVAAGELVSFTPEKGLAELQHTRTGAVSKLDLGHVRWIKLTRGFALMADVTAAAAGRDAVADTPFNVTLRDGMTLSGTTRGSVRSDAGLFLYIVENHAPLANACFIPARQIVAVHALPGPAPDATAAAAAAAANEPELPPHQRIVRYLSARAIVSEDGLRNALRQQVHRPPIRIGEVLIAAKVITPAQLDAALKIQALEPGRKIGQILVASGVVSPRLIQMALSDKLGIPYVDLRSFVIDPLTLELIDSAFAMRHQVLPLLRSDDALVIAVENPMATDFVQELQFKSEMTIIPVMADPDELRVRITSEYLRPESVHYKAGGGADLSKIKIEDLTSELTQQMPQSTPVANLREEAHISDNALVRLINRIIIEAHAQGASDIHIESNPGKGATHIRFRKDGDLENYLDLPPAYRGALVSRIKIMAGLDISEHRHGQDGKINFAQFGPLPIELRVAIIPTSNNLEDVVLRLLGGVEPLPLDKLGFERSDLDTLKTMIARSYGLILVCGPTGSGKTTTLHSVLHHINRPDLKIWTAEDPVEISQPGLRQVQVQSKIGWTFAAAMRSFLRADPDVIMVGEMRDAETTKIGIEASLTGHLVFSTLHTNSAAESVVRLLDLGMDPFNFADALIGILSQRLARRLCPVCKRSHVATDAEISELLDEYCAETDLDKADVLAQWRARYAVKGDLVLHEPRGCDKCREGYKGRMGVYELLSGTNDVKQLVRQRGTVPQIVAAGRKGGMRLLRQDAIEKVLQGLLDRASARTASS